MRSHLSQEEFFQKMKKKPALQAILDRLEQYTIEELEIIYDQPLWIRQILVKMKDGSLETRTEDQKIQVANQVAEEMLKNSPSHSIIPKHKVRRWIGGFWLMPCGMTGGMSIEINPDDLFLIMDAATHFVTISSSYSTLDQTKWAYFLQNTIELGIMTRSEYAELVSNKLSNNFTSQQVAIAKIAGPNSYVEPNNNGFEIIRHPVK